MNEISGVEEKETACVVFLPSGKRGRFAVGTQLLQAARELGVDIDSVCGGRGICGRCQINISEGEFAKHNICSDAQHLSPLNESEKRFFKKKPQFVGRRLSCHALLRGDLVIDVPPESQVHRQVVRKDAEQLDIRIDPTLSAHYVTVEQPNMADPRGDSERLLDALKNALQEKGHEINLQLDNHLLPQLQSILRKGQWCVTAAVRGQHVVALWPEFQPDLFGISIDLGSTTVAAHLCNLENGEVIASCGVMNPQIRFGEDLMSRVSYSMMNPGGDKEMTQAIGNAIGDLVIELCRSAKIDSQHVMEVTLVANPVMHHLFLGIDPVELGGAPFALAVDSALTLQANQLGLPLPGGTNIYLLPCIAGHVGADTAGMILAEYPKLKNGVNLLVDVGTNAEIVLGNHNRLVAASSPTGPAFEGAQISCGQRAAMGAIERVRIDKQTLEPSFKIIGCSHWSNDKKFSLQDLPNGITGVCGSGIIELISELYLAEILDSNGVFRTDMSSQCPRLEPDGRTLKYRLTDGARPLYLTQNDVRAIQLAKAALYAGIKLLMDHLGVDHIDRIRLAGAFGAQIDVKYAMILGLIPDCNLDEVSSAGNAAGTGARIALLNNSSRSQIESIVKNIEKIETALAPEFQQYFVDAMAIPHNTDSHTHLEKSVSLPKQQPSAVATTRRRRRKAR